MSDRCLQQNEDDILQFGGFDGSRHRNPEMTVFSPDAAGERQDKSSVRALKSPVHLWPLNLFDFMSCHMPSSATTDDLAASSLITLVVFLFRSMDIF